MFSRGLLNGLCLAICIGCLVVGYALAGQWVIFPVSLVALAVWIGDRKWPRSGLSVVALVLSVGLAGTGLLVGASPILMIVSTAFALAGWDMANFYRNLDGNAAGVDAHLEMRHLQSLALALGLSLVIALAGRFLIFRIPFGIVLLLLIAVLYSLDRVWRLLTD